MNAPIFEPGELVQLEAIVETAKELAIQAERNAEVLRRIATQLDHSLKRADQMRRQAAVQPPRTQLRRDGRPTTSAKGPKKILEMLRDYSPEGVTLETIEAETLWAASTVRTYLPCLQEAGYIKRENGYILLTPSGRNAIDAPQPLGFLSR